MYCSSLLVLLYSFYWSFKQTHSTFALKWNAIWVRFHKTANKAWHGLLLEEKGDLTPSCAFLVPLWCLANLGCVILTA